eukprot:1373395-Pleurochrysis_carterae.AAC.1
MLLCTPILKFVTANARRVIRSCFPALCERDCCAFRCILSVLTSLSLAPTPEVRRYPSISCSLCKCFESYRRVLKPRSPLRSHIYANALYGSKSYQHLSLNGKEFALLLYHAVCNVNARILGRLRVLLDRLCDDPGSSCAADFAVRWVRCRMAVSRGLINSCGPPGRGGSV